MSKPAIQAKADFSDIYYKENPFDYLSEMRKLNYRIPDLTLPLYLFFARKINENKKEKVSVFDIGSSYGINSALITYNISMKDLDNFFLKNNTPPTIHKTIKFFGNTTEKNSFLDFYLLDMSYEALKFAGLAGLCKESFCENLEEKDPGKSLLQTLSTVDLFISTGCVGYVTEKTFERLFEGIKVSTNDFESLGPTPIFAFSTLRMFDLNKIKKIFTKNDFFLLKTEIPPINQRKFQGKAEQKAIISILKSKNINTVNLEEKGNLYADFYVGGPVHHEDLITSWIEEFESLNWAKNFTGELKF